MQHKTDDARSWFWVLVLTIVLVAGPDTAEAEGVLPDDIQSGSLLLRMASGYETATLLKTDVDMKISGLVSRVRVRQEFENTGPDWVEGIYVFPLPAGAAVDRMRLYVGDRFIEGEIQEKERAERTYEQARKSGKRASLVEQQRPNLFTTRVANVAPGALVVVEIEYLEKVRYESGKFSIRFPMTLTPRYVPGTALPDKVGSGWSADTDRVPDASLITPPQVSSSPAHRLTLTADINAGMPLKIIASRYHPVQVSENSGRYTISLRSGSVPMDHDFELVWQPVASAGPRALAFAEELDGKLYQLLMVMPPDVETETPLAMPRDLVLVLDTSGSMHGVSIQQAKAAVQLALENLNVNDRFNVIEFNSTTRTLHDSSMAATPGAIRDALDFVDNLEAQGGTEMRPALAHALGSPATETHLRQVVFVTDGSVGYEDEMFNYIEEHLGAARLFTVGIGSAPNSWFMQKAAEAGRGTYTFVSALHEVEEKMADLFRKLEQPEVTNIEVDWPSGVRVDSFPAKVQDLYSGQPVTVRVEVSGAFQDGDRVRVSGNTVGGAWTAELPVSAAAPGPGVAALWARARIAELGNLERRHTDPQEIRQAIVDTAIRHHLVSKYTSLVAVDKTPVRPADETLKKEQVPNLLPHGQSAEAIFGFPATATSAPWQRQTGIAFIAVALLLFAVRRRFRVTDHASVRR